MNDLHCRPVEVWGFANTYIQMKMSLGFSSSAVVPTTQLFYKPPWEEFLYTVVVSYMTWTWCGNKWHET